MSRFIVLGWLCLGLLACQAEPAPAPEAPATPSAAQLPAHWEGRVGVSYDPQTLQAAGTEHLVIRDQAAYQALIARIPRYQIGKTEPQPPSDDPLLRTPAPDFQREMLLVAIRSDSMYVPPRLEKLDTLADKLIVTVAYPPLGDAAYYAQPLEIGAYAAWRVPRSDLPVEWRE